MLRVRLATLATAAGLALLSGCAGMNSDRPLLSRLCGRHRATEPCVIESGGYGGCSDCGIGGGMVGGMVGDGPILMDRGPITTMPPSTMVPAVPLAPDSSLPLAPAPRLVPQPQPPTQSQPIPYTP